MILLIGYAYVGYPIVAYVLSKLKPVGKEHNKNFYAENNVDLPNVTAVIVIHNEGQRIIDKITNLKELSYDQDKLSILIVNDHCTDNSVELLNKHYPDVTVITNNGRGKAAGINTAYQNINDELVLMLDARQMLESQALISLVNNFVDSQVGAISGELMIESMDGNRFANAMGGYWKYEKFVRKCEAKIGKVPGVTGAIYMIRRKAFRAIDENTLLDDVLIPMNAAKLGYKIGFETNAIAWDVPSDDPKREKRRKVRTLAGNYQLLFRHLWWCIPFMHPIAFQFISHKILRILVPFFAIMASTLLSILSETTCVSFISKPIHTKAVMPVIMMNDMVLKVLISVFRIPSHNPAQTFVKSPFRPFPAGHPNRRP